MLQIFNSVRQDSETNSIERNVCSLHGFYESIFRDASEENLSWKSQLKQTSQASLPQQNCPSLFHSLSIVRQKSAFAPKIEPQQQQRPENDTVQSKDAATNVRADAGEQLSNEVLASSTINYGLLETTLSQQNSKSCSRGISCVSCAHEYYGDVYSNCVIQNQDAVSFQKALTESQVMDQISQANLSAIQSLTPAEPVRSQRVCAPQVQKTLFKPLSSQQQKIQRRWKLVPAESDPVALKTTFAPKVDGDQQKVENAKQKETELLRQLERKRKQEEALEKLTAKSSRTVDVAEQKYNSAINTQRRRTNQYINNMQRLRLRYEQSGVIAKSQVAKEESILQDDPQINVLPTPGIKTLSKVSRGEQGQAQDTCSESDDNYNELQVIKMKTFMQRRMCAALRQQRREIDTLSQIADQIGRELNPSQKPPKKESLLDKLKSSESSSSLFQHPCQQGNAQSHRGSSAQFQTLQPMQKMPSKLQTTCATAVSDVSLAFENLLLDIDAHDFHFVPQKERVLANNDTPEWQSGKFMSRLATLPSDSFLPAEEKCASNSADRDAHDSPCPDQQPVELLVRASQSDDYTSENMFQVISQNASKEPVQSAQSSELVLSETQVKELTNGVISDSRVVKEEKENDSHLDAPEKISLPNDANTNFVYDVVRYHEAEHDAKKFTVPSKYEYGQNSEKDSIPDRKTSNSVSESESVHQQKDCALQKEIQPDCLSGQSVANDQDGQAEIATVNNVHQNNATAEQISARKERDAPNLAVILGQMKEKLLAHNKAAESVQKDTLEAKESPENIRRLPQKPDVPNLLPNKQTPEPAIRSTYLVLKATYVTLPLLEQMSLGDQSGKRLESVGATPDAPSSHKKIDNSDQKIVEQQTYAQEKMQSTDNGENKVVSAGCGQQEGSDFQGNKSVAQTYFQSPRQENQTLEPDKQCTVESTESETSSRVFQRETQKISQENSGQSEESTEIQMSSSTQVSERQRIRGRVSEPSDSTQINSDAPSTRSEEEPLQQVRTEKEQNEKAQETEISSTVLSQDGQDKTPKTATRLDPPSAVKTPEEEQTANIQEEKSHGPEGTAIQSLLSRETCDENTQNGVHEKTAIPDALRPETPRKKTFKQKNKPSPQQRALLPPDQNKSAASAALEKAIGEVPGSSTSTRSSGSSAPSAGAPPDQEMYAGHSPTSWNNALGNRQEEERELETARVELAEIATKNQARIGNLPKGSFRLCKARRGKPKVSRVAKAAPISDQALGASADRNTSFGTETAGAPANYPEAIEARHLASDSCERSNYSAEAESSSVTPSAEPWTPSEVEDAPPTEFCL